MNTEQVRRDLERRYIEGRYMGKLMDDIERSIDDAMSGSQCPVEFDDYVLNGLRNLLDQLRAEIESR